MTTSSGAVCCRARDRQAWKSRSICMKDRRRILGVIRPWLVAVSAVTMVAPARADRAVTGSVVDDATGLPVAGALVTVGGSEAVTDDQGRFRAGEIAFGRLDVM